MTVHGEQWKVIHQHYIKPVTNKHVIRKDAAMPMRTKRTVLTQMCLKVLLNNSEYLERETRKETVEFFVRRMQASGYGERFRYEVLRSALKAYQEIKNNPVRPIYREKGTERPQEKKARQNRRKEWYKREG